MAEKDQFDSEWDNTRFPAERDTGVIMGLDWAQVIFLSVFGLGASVAMVFVLGFPFGMLAAIGNLLIAAAIGIPRFWGRSSLLWAFTAVRFLWRGSKGQLRYQRRLSVVSTSADRQQWEQDPDSRPGRDKHTRVEPGEGYRLHLPGELNELRVYHLPDGAGFVFDRRRREGVVIARLQTRRAFALESNDDQEERTRGFRDQITNLSGIKGVSRIQMSDQTTMVSGAKVKSFYEQKRAEAPRVSSPDGEGTVPLSGPAINPWTHHAYQDYIAGAQEQPLHEMWLTIVLSAHDLERRSLAAGGGLRGFMEVSLGVMGNVEQMVAASGLKVIGWHTPRSIGALSKTTWDPSSALEVSDREGDWAGASPEASGPTGIEVSAIQIWSDGWFHRTFEISEWPRGQARLGFLEKLVFAGPFRHTVTVVFKPKDIRMAMRKTQQRKADIGTATRMMSKMDRPETLEHQRELEDVEKEELDLMEGHAAVDVVGLITVSAKTEEEIESHAADIKAKATAANCEIRPVMLQQDVAFTAAAMPYGRAILA